MQIRTKPPSAPVLALPWFPPARSACARARQIRLSGRSLVTLDAADARLLVLDPLVRLHRGDENSSAEICELLGFLRTQQREHQVAIMLVHHVRSSAAGQPGQSLRGSGDLHAWGDSNLYLLRNNGKLLMHAEHPSPQRHPRSTSR